MPDVNILVNATDKSGPALSSAKGGLDSLASSAHSTSGALGSFNTTGNQLWSALGTVAVAAAAAAAVAIGGLVMAFGDSVSQARESIAANNQLEAVLKSTGGAAGVTSEQAKALASSLQLVTNFGDEATLGAENMLLTFTNIGSNVFPRATKTTLDMSQALGQDLKSSAIQLGKALNDPIAGISALSRVGVTFNDQQKEIIKTMVEAGDVAGAQGVILDELAKEFGGSAEAMADPAIMLQNAFGELKEQVGMFLVPVLNNLAKQAMPYLAAATDALSKAVGIFNDYLKEGRPIIDSVKEAIAAVLPPSLLPIWTGFIDVVDRTIRVVQSLFGQAQRFEDEPPIVGWLLDLGEMAGGTFTYFYQQAKKVIDLLWDWGSRVIPPLIEGLDKFFTNMGLIWDALVKIAKPVTDAIAKFVSFDDIMTALAIFLGGSLLAAIYGVVAGLATFLAPIAAVVAAVALLRAAWENDFLGIRTFTLTTITKITDWFYNQSGIWQGTWEKTLSKLGNTIEIFWERSVYFLIRSWLIQTRDDMKVHLRGFEILWEGWARATRETIEGWVGDGERLFTNWKDIIITTFHDWIDPIVDMVGKWAIGVRQDFERFIDWVVKDFNDWKEWLIEKVFTPVLDWWADHIDPWIQYGRDVIQGFWDGFKETWNRFSNWTSQVWESWVSRFRDFFGIHSPSSLFRLFGQDLMEGLGEGIEAYSHIPVDYVDSMTNSLTAQMERIRGAVVKNIFDINNAAAQLHIDPRLLPASMGGTGNVVGTVAGGLLLGGITNLPYSNGLPGPVAPVVPTTTLGSAVGGNTTTTGTGQSLLGGINLTTPDLAGAAASAAAAAQKVKDFIAGIGDFIGSTVSTSTLSKVFNDAFNSTVGAPGQGYGELHGAQDKIREQMASLLGLPQIFGTLDAKGNLDALTKKIGSGTDLDKVASLLQSAVDFRTLANYYDAHDQYATVLPTDPRLTGNNTTKSNTTNYNITLQGSGNAAADILGLIQMLGSLQGSATP